MNIFKTNKALRKELKELKELIEEERAIAIDNAGDMLDMEEKATSEIVIEKILGEGLKSHDILSKSMEYRREYYAEAHNILNSEVFKNESAIYIKQLVEGIAKTSKGFDEVLALRYSINGVQVLKDRLKKIENPDAITGPTMYNVHDAL